MKIDNIQKITKKMTDKGFSEISHSGMSHDGRFYFNAILNKKEVEVKACGTRYIIFVRNNGEWVVA